MDQWFYILEAWMAQIPEPIGTLVNYTLVFLLLAFLFILPLVTFTVLIERKVLGFMQHRFGPNRVGPRGWLQTIADAIKLIQKEDITPKEADPIPFWLAPVVTFVPVFVSFVVIGMGGMWSDEFHHAGTEVFRDFKVWAPTDLNIGLLLVLAMSSLAAIGVFMAGWASNNKYSIFGSMRGVAQMISYEVPMVLTLLAVVLMTGSMSLKDVALQQGPRWQAYPRDHAIQVSYLQLLDVDAQALEARLAELAPQYSEAAAEQAKAIEEQAAAVLDADQELPAPKAKAVELTDQNRPLVQVIRRGTVTAVRIGVNSDIAGPLTMADVAEPLVEDAPQTLTALLAAQQAVKDGQLDLKGHRLPTLLEVMAGEVLPAGWDARYTRFSLGTTNPVKWTMVSGGIPFLIPMFLGFIVFFITAVAETNRAPFDLPEAESELVSGFHTEYTGMKFALFFLGEYAAMILMASLATICFLGAWWVPWFMTPLAERWPVLYFFSFFLKMYALIYVMIWFRATFPRLRPDQLMDYAWKRLFPLSLINLLVVGYFTFADWHWDTLRQVNYQLWYNNVIAGLDWPVWRLLIVMLLLPLLPDAFNAAYPRVKKHLTPFLWIFTIGFVTDKLILDFVFKGQRLPHTILMDLVWIASLWFLGKALLALAEGLPQERLFRLSHFTLMAIVPVASIIAMNVRTNPGVAEVFSYLQAVMWWVATVPIALGLWQLSQQRQPEKRVAILANEAVGYKPVSLNFGDTKAEILATTELSPFYERPRPAGMQTPAGPEDIPDWRTALFPDEEREQPAAIPGQQNWGKVKPLPGMNTR